jgi:DNA polymerase-4/protein ImuB
MRLLCVILPHFYWRCEARRRPELEGLPAILTRASGSQKVVMDHSPDLDDLQRDMPLQQALSRHGQSVLLHADIPHYRTVFNEILDGLETVSPLVEGPEPGLAYVGIDGLQLLYPDDDALIDAVRKVVPDDFTPLFGIAGNKFLAYLAARQSPPGGPRVVSGNAGEFLNDLPCDVLPVSPRSKRKLHDFGITTLGQVAALPPGPVQAQLGPEGERIWNLARGDDDTPLYPRFLAEVIEEDVTLASVTISLEAILAAADSMLGKVFEKTRQAGLGIQSLTVWTRTWNAEEWERTIQFKDPAMDLKTAMGRVKRVLEDYPQPGPVEQVGIRINRLGYPSGRQRSLFPDLRARDHLMNDIRQLELRLGNPQVYSLKEVEPWSRIPERRYALTPTGR